MLFLIATWKMEHKDSKTFACPECGNEFTHRENFDRHVQNEHDGNDKPFHCLRCEAQFAHKHLFKKHIQEVHHVHENFDFTVYKWLL